MKRFFYAIIAVVAALGFAACEKDSTEITEGALSFYATIEGGDSRIAMSQTGDVWNSTWEGDESLTVTPNFDSYFVFTNTADNPNRFSCTMAGVEALKSAEKVYVFNSQALNSVNSTIGADGMFLYAETAWAENITLVASAAMLHYSSEYYVTLTAQDMFGDGNSGRLSEVTLAAGESVFVPIFAGKATLSYSIAGKVCKSMELDAKAGVVYELGTLAPAGDTPTPDPTPDPAGNTLYLVPNADWSASGAWFAAYYWDTAGGNGSVKFTDDNADGIYEGVLPSTAEGMLFCRMNPAYPEFGWNSETETDRVWNQTGDLTVGVAPNNYFYITGWDTGEWNVAGYVPEVPAQSFSLAGSFNSWGDLVMTHSEGIYSALGVAMEANCEFKVKDTTTWDISYGGGVAVLNPNHYMKVYASGANITIAEAGTYDVYFDLNNLNLYVVTAGTDYTTVPLQEEGSTGGGGDTPSTGSFAVAGTFNGWGDLVMTPETGGIHSAKGVALEAYAELKIKDAATWDISFGGGIMFLNPNNHMQLFEAGSNVSITEAGTYDIYFDSVKLLLYVVTAGADYTTAPLQTENGKEPEVVEPDVTDAVLYLVPNNNWKVDGARFAAYFFNASGNTWVSMTDKDADGIYEVNIPVGYKVGENVIFCRMNPSSTANSWSTKWNQTEDLVIPTDGKNLYTVKEDTWDKGGGSWSVK